MTTVLDHVNPVMFRRHHCQSLTDSPAVCFRNAISLLHYYIQVYPTPAGNRRCQASGNVFGTLPFASCRKRKAEEEITAVEDKKKSNEWKKNYEVSPRHIFFSGFPIWGRRNGFEFLSSTSSCLVVLPPPSAPHFP